MTSVNYVVALFTQYFLFLAVTMGKFTTFFVTSFTVWINAIQIFWNFLDGVYTTGIHVWNDMLSPWLQLVPVFIMVYSVYRIIDDGFEAFQGDVNFVINIFSFLGNIFMTVIQLVIRIVTALIESLPIGQ